MTRGGSGPPDFEAAANRRQKVRAAGLDPNYWYAVEHDHAVPAGRVVEVEFWGESVALFRDERGRLHAVENRCAHRQLKLSVGQVVGDRLVCQYHGWAYNGSGRLAHVPHDLFGKKMPNCRLQSHPVRSRYGLVWIFFGDPQRADAVPIPDIPELEGSDRWAAVTVDFTWRAHHSMIIDNVSDFTHAWLHRKYEPFSDPVLTSLESRDDKVYVSYRTKVGRGRLARLLIDHGRLDTSSIDLCYDYPYQRSDTGGEIRHWCFVLPIDERKTRVFFIFYFKSIKVPILPIAVPRGLMEPVLRVASELHIRPLLAQDGLAVEAEQAGYDVHYDAPIAELSPAVLAFQALTVRKWEDHLERQSRRGPAEPADPPKACGTLVTLGRKAEA